MEPKREIAYIQWLRLLAAAAVVLMHTAADGWNTLPPESWEWRALSGWESLVRWPVPVFVMMTGALFLPRRTPLKRILTHYIPRMLLCFLVWSWVYVLHGKTAPENVPAALAAGHFHLWYLPFLCGVYLVIPFVQRIAEDERLMKQLLALSLVLGLALPWLADVGRLWLPDQAKVIAALKNHLNYAFFMDHLSFLLLGHWLHRTELSPAFRRTLYVLGLMGPVATFLGTGWVTELTGAAGSLFFAHGAPGTVCTAAALFVFAKRHLNRLPWLADRLAKWSFGIYLVHPLILDLLAENGLDVLTWDPRWWTPVLAALALALSAAVTALLSRLPVVGKYLT